MKDFFNLLNNIFKMSLSVAILLLFFASCEQSTSTQEEVTSPITPVQVTNIADSAMTDLVEFPAVSAYLEKYFIKANINGYVNRTNIKVGQQVGSGQVLFSLITKEAKSIGNSINKLDPSFKFSGISLLRANGSGIVVQVNHQEGDYVQEGELLATVSNRNSLVFLLDLPYEFNQIISSNKNLEVKLPDGKKLKGMVSGTMPSVDSLAQTQRFIIKVRAIKDLPEGLIGGVRLVKSSHPFAQVLPKSAILANETEDEFWVMKLINDSIAVKIKVNKGIEGSSMTEVISPKFQKSDRIIVIGNYGLSDTAKVKIQK